MKKIIMLTLPAIMLTALAGCSTVRSHVSDNSLDYQKATVLPPLQVPTDAQTLPFTPLYQVPKAGQNTLTLQNEEGKRFELPKPIATIK